MNFDYGVRKERDNQVRRAFMLRIREEIILVPVGKKFSGQMITRIRLFLKNTCLQRLLLITLCQIVDVI